MKKLVYPPPDSQHLCTCTCHTPPGVLHLVPCCDVCECGAPIRFECFAAHKATCVPRKNRHKTTSDTLTTPGEKDVPL